MELSRGGPVGKRRRKNRTKGKLCVVFDEEKRKEFLTGFQKRNLEKKEKAREKLLEKLKEEKKRIKKEAKESYKKLVKSTKPIPELEDLFNDEFETEEATVKVVELSTDSIAEGSQWIGRNRPRVCEDEESLKSETSEEEKMDELPGMELKKKNKKRSSHADESNPLFNCMSKKEINKIIKKEATQKIQNSKVFKAKSKLDRKKNKKKSMLAKKRNISNKHSSKTNKKIGNKMGRGRRK